MLQDCKLLPKNEILNCQITLSTQRRSQRSSDDCQPLEHVRNAIGAIQEKPMNSTQTNKREGQVARGGIEPPTRGFSVLG